MDMYRCIKYKCNHIYLFIYLFIHLSIFCRKCHPLNVHVRGGIVFSILVEGSSDTLANNEDQDEISGPALFAKIKQSSWTVTHRFV